MLVPLLSLLCQVALALSQCQCQEYGQYYCVTNTQPSYDYSEYQYNPYSPTGYSISYGTYTQPTTPCETPVNTIVYPYPVPVVYESPKQEAPSCSCGCKESNRPCSETRHRYDDEEREYTTARCTCTSTEYESSYWDDRDSKPRCGCKYSGENRRDSERYYDRDYENSDGRRSKVKCVCVYDESDDFRDDEWERRESRQEGRRCGCQHRDDHRDCGCGCKHKRY